MKVAEKNTVGGSHDMATADNRLDARRKRCKIGVDDGPFNANGNICCPSGKSRVTKHPPNKIFSFFRNRIILSFECAAP
jgi:hypothetical protein